MSRIKLLLDVVEDMRSLADSIQAVATAVTESDSPTGSRQESEPMQSVVEPEQQTQAPAEAETPAITLEQVRAVLVGRSRSGHREEVRTLLGKYGSGQLSDVDPRHYAALLEDAEEIGDAT